MRILKLATTMMLPAFFGLCVLGAGSAKACQECQLRKQGTYLGQFTILGDGTVRTWVKFANGKPASLGVTFSEMALQGLPTVEKLPKAMPVMEYELALPKEARNIGFDHISLDYGPVGHPPADIYDKAHFDVHFYMMPSAERKKITARGKDLAVCEKKPDAGTLPVGYILAPGTAIPQMGVHAVDPSGPEFRGEGFTKTFIYGYYNGKMTFIEPMVAVDYLKTKPNSSGAVKAPLVYQRPGFYPTKYSITFDEKRREYSVSLDGLTWRTPPLSTPPLSTPPLRTPPTTRPVTKTKVAAQKRVPGQIATKANSQQRSALALID
jgi:hypothetical protein